MYDNGSTFSSRKCEREARVGDFGREDEENEENRKGKERPRRLRRAKQILRKKSWTRSSPFISTRDP